MKCVRTSNMALRSDEPPNSRLFILCQKGITEQEFREHFGEYGTIDDIWIVKDKRTNEDRGIVYIKFRRTSEAILAMEEMNGRCMAGQPKPLKVMVANSKRDGSTRDPREDEKLVRLFIICPKSFTVKDLRDEFEKYGDLDHVTVIRDRGSGESKGFGYVKYHRPYHAALAYERCNVNDMQTFESECSVYFEPPQPLQTTSMTDTAKGGYSQAMDADGFDLRPATRDRVGPSTTLTSSVTPCDCCELQVMAPVGMTRAYLTQLFSLVPGLEYCDLNETTGVAYAMYTTPQCAAYAKDNLNGFEYPMGSPLWVQFADLNTSIFSEPLQYSESCFSVGGGDEITDLRQKAANLLEQAGIDPQAVMAAAGSGQAGAVVGVGASNMERVNYCSIPLPVPQPLVPDTCPIVQRLFIVCQPSAVSERVLRDAFSRFGNLIDVFLLAGRNYGYAKYASKESAMKAIKTLHGQNLSGQRIKVLEAEPPKGVPDSGCGQNQTA